MLNDIQNDPFQIDNLYPREKDGDGQERATNTDKKLEHLIHRLDSLLMVMKSCKGRTCREPWAVLHPEGDVGSLQDALDSKFHPFYEEQAKVSFSRCEPGYIIASEGPQVGYEYREGLSWSDWA